MVILLLVINVDQIFFDGEKLKNLRKQHNLTQADVCFVTGLSQKYISKLENNIWKMPNMYVLVKLAIFFKLRMEDFLNQKIDQ